MQEEFDLAISCSGTDKELGAALYRRIVEHVPRNRVYFYPLRPESERELGGAELLRHLEAVYANSRVVVFIVGTNHTSLLEWEVAAAVRARISGSLAEFFILKREGAEVPAALSALKGTIRFPDSVAKKTRWADVARAADVIIHKHYRESTAEDSVSAGGSVGPLRGPPIVVKRHIHEFRSSSDYKQDFDAANGGCGNSCDVARTGVHSTAALLGSAEQYERATRLAAALRELLPLTNVDELAAFPSRRRRRSTWIDARHDAQFFVTHRVLTNLISPSERRHQQSRDQGRTAEHIILNPDPLQLLERLRGYLLRYLGDSLPMIGTVREFIAILAALLELVPPYRGTCGDLDEDDRVRLRDVNRLAKEILEKMDVTMTKLAPCTGLPEIPPNVADGSLLRRLRAIAQTRESSQTRHR